MIVTNRHKNIPSAHTTQSLKSPNKMINNVPRPPQMQPSQPKQIVTTVTPPQPQLSRSEQVKILRDKFLQAFQNRLRGNTALYSQLVTHFGNLRGLHLAYAYEALALCAASVDETFSEFLELIFRPNIAHVLYQKGEIIETYNNMVVSLLTTHPNYLQHAMKLVTTNIKPISELDLMYLQSSKDILPTQLETIPLLEQIKYDNIHLLLNLITKKLPNCLPNLVKRLEQEYPYHTQALSKHRAYVTNILRIVDYCPQLVNNIFQIVVQQLIKLDSEIKVDRDEEEEEDDDEEEEEFTMSQTQMFEEEDMREDMNEEHRQIIMAEKLDSIIYVVLSFVQQQSRSNKIDILFQSMMRMFHSFVVNTYQLHSIQFLMFYICSFNEKYISNFVQFLLNKVFDQQLHQEVRKCCAAYLSGFISRAKYCTVQTVIAALGKLLEWADSYVQTFERTVNYLDVESHSIFYSICQGVFYVLCYKIDDIMKSENGVQFLQNEAPIAKIVRSKFNPFKIIALDVAHEVTQSFEHYFFNFANEFYQIMERNKNVMVPIKGSYGGVNYLENDFFPFDPFLLRQSQHYIQPLYQKWEGSTRVTHRRGSNGGLVLSPKDEYLEEFVGRGRGNSITDRAKMFFSGSLNQPKISGSLGSNSTKLGSSLMDDDDMFSDDEDEDQDVDFDEDVSSSDEGEVHYDDEEDHSMFMSAVELRNGMNRKTPQKSGSYSRSVEDDLFASVQVPYGWEYTLDVYSTESKRRRK